VTLKDHKDKNNNMYENSHSWRRKLRLQTLVDIARKEMVSGKEFDDFSHILEQEMQIRWKLVPSTRKQYLDTLKKILANQFVLVK
jgi:hypothetical protein